MTHAVEVDEEAIRAALDEHAAPPPGVSPDEPPQPTAAVPAPDPEAWRKPCELLASIIAHKGCPNWQVPPDTQQQWAGALAACLGQMWPGGIGNIERWGPWSKLAFASLVWAFAGFDVERFAFKPLAPPKGKSPPPATAGAAADGDDAPRPGTTATVGNPAGSAYFGTSP